MHCSSHRVSCYSRDMVQLISERWPRYDTMGRGTPTPNWDDVPGTVRWIEEHETLLFRTMTSIWYNGSRNAIHIGMDQQYYHPS
jgi:hypothetical protein